MKLGKLVGLGLVVLFGFELVGCGDKTTDEVNSEDKIEVSDKDSEVKTSEDSDPVNDTLKDFIISNANYLGNYKIELDRDNNQIILNEDEYKTEYLNQSEEDMNTQRWISSRYLLLASSFPDDSAKVVIKDIDGNSILEFSNGEITDNDDSVMPIENFEAMMERAASSKEDRMDKEKSIESIKEVIKGRTGIVKVDFVSKDNHNADVVFNDDMNDMDHYKEAISLILGGMLESSDNELTVNFFSSDKVKLAQINRGGLVSYNKDIFEEGFMDDYYQDKMNEFNVEINED